MPRIKKVTTAIYCNRYKPNKEGLCVISIRVTWSGVKRNYDTGYQMTASAFDGLFSPKIRPDQKTILMALNAEEQRAQDMIDRLKTGFTWDRFNKGYLTNIAISDSLKGAFNDYVATMDPEKQFTTITSYETTRNSFEKFRANTMLGDVSPAYLRNYESWMLNNSNSITSVGVYCRNLRAVLNWVINDGKMSRELYPFGKVKDKKYEIPEGRNPKKALPTDDIAAIFNYDCEMGSKMEMARDYWIFRYLANGIDMKDFCLLKWSRVCEDGIHFIRAKTINTKRVREATIIPIRPEMLDIIRRWGNPNKGQDEHVFPHLEPGMCAKEIRNKVQLLTKLVNKYMRVITKDLGIKRPALTKDARHSFATVLKNSGAPMALISELLVHSSSKTTQNYLDSFEDKQVRRHTAVLANILHRKAGIG
jgi:integrase/recombinase XerD